MTAPTIVFLLVMTVYPVLFTIYYSFTDYNYLKGTHPFSGLANYTALFQNMYFRQAVSNTVKFTVIAVVLEVVLGLLTALFVKSLKRGQKVVRTLLLLPYLLPAVTVALIWRMMLSPNYGIITDVFTALGLPVYNWFYDGKTAFGTLLVIDVWQNVPFAFLLIYRACRKASIRRPVSMEREHCSAFAILRFPTLAVGLRCVPCFVRLIRSGCLKR